MPHRWLQKDGCEKRKHTNPIFPEILIKRRKKKVVKAKYRKIEYTYNGFFLNKMHNASMK